MIRDYLIDDPAGLELLYQAARCLDEMADAEAIIAADGVITEDRFGCKIEHPAYGILRKSRDQYRRIIRELGLNLEPVKNAGRPPLTVMDRKY